MKPILFEKNATVFTTLGLCRLPDAISCTVTEERNGAYELELVYPVSGRYFDEIAEDRILAAIPSDGADKQAFRIYRITTPINGQVTVNARHISYQLNNIPIDATSGSGTAQTAMGALKAAALETCPFTFESDITGSASYVFEEPVSLKAALGGMEGSILDTYGGEFEWDNWTVKLHTARGKDNGVRITYGKNLTELTRSVDMGDLITGVAAYWKGEDENGNVIIVQSSPKVVSNANAGDYSYHRTIPLDLSGEFEDKPTAAEVTTAATAFLSQTTLAQISETVEVNFVALWQSPEYIAYAPLERVGLCDTVYIGYPQFGIAVKKKVTRTVYNVLLERYDSIELGGELDVSDTIAGLAESSETTDAIIKQLQRKTNFVVESVEETNATSIAAGSYRSTSLSVSKDGYRPIALAGFTTNNQNVCIVKAILNGNSVEFNFRNVSGSAANSKAGFSVLYIQN